MRAQERAKNADGQKFVVVIAAPVPENERTTVARDTWGGAREGFRSKGGQVIAERQLVVNNLPFDTFTVRMPDGATITTWIISAGNEVYSLEGVHKGGGSDSDAELQSVLSSFHLLSPAEVNTPPVVSSSIAYRIGHILPPLVILGLIGIGIVWFVRRMKAKKTDHSLP